MDNEWAAGELRTFIQRCERHRELWKLTDGGDPSLRALKDEIISSTPVIHRIADRAWPDWGNYVPKRRSMSWEYEPLLEIAKQTLLLVERQQELDEKLGDPGPALMAASFHPDVWQAAQGPWRNGHYGDAVRAAARCVNAALQSRTGRRDKSDADLVAESFSLNPPAPGAPRLRLMEDDGSDTYKSLQAGAIAFGQGCFKAIRNVLNHEFGELAEPPEPIALEYLAAFSVLARWIQEADRVD